MSKVKIQGNASGTGVLTVTAPNTSTDRTITLPDSTDTLAVNSDVTNKLPLAGGTLTGELTVTQNSNSEAIDVVTNATTANGLRVNASDLTTGKGAYFYSNSGDTSTRQLVRITNDHASSTGTTLLYADNDSTGLVADFHGAGGVKINSGNLIIGTNGKGIDFSAASNASSMTSELLDDYEEGLHTTSAGSGGGSITLNTTNNKFYYTKIGRQVTITGRIDVDSVSSPTGDLYFTLPFVSSAAGGSQNSSSAGGLFVWNPTSGDAGLWVAWIDSNGSSVYLRYASGNQAAQAANLVQAATEFRIGLSYMTD
jgi:hypothetical protein